MTTGINTRLDHKYIPLKFLTKFRLNQKHQKNYLTDKSVYYIMNTVMKNDYSKSARERILDTAFDLFYRQGYFQTGINQIIDEAGVAKATFYNNFRSKEELCTEYLRTRNRVETELTRDMISGIDDPYEKYIKLTSFMIDHMKDSDFRGCAFNNMAIEVTEPDNPIRNEVRNHNDGYRALLREVVTELKNSDKKYSHINVDEVVNSYFLISEGALTASQIYHSTWPLEHAVKAIEKLIQK